MSEQINYISEITNRFAPATRLDADAVTISTKELLEKIAEAKCIAIDETIANVILEQLAQAGYKQDIDVVQDTMHYLWYFKIV